MSALNPTRANLLKMFALDTAMVRGTGERLFDEDGREYLDFLAQYGALPFGHNPQPVWDALNAARDEQLPSMVQPLRPVETERLAERLAAIAPGDLGVVTFTNSGAESVEAALKLARVRSGKSTILSAWNGFHGKTLGALSATGKPMYQAGFEAPAPGFEYLPYGDLAALEARLSEGAEDIAALILEPIQGEGGVVCPPEGYVDAAIRVCHAHDVLVILDEIQTGLGRTGELFACSSGSEVPDILLLAKALGGGMMPIGACIARPSVWDDAFGRLHSSTFANNNHASRVANATLDMLLEDDSALIRNVAENGAYLHDRLRALQDAYPEVIREVRGRGYMVGLEFHRFDERTDSATMAFASLNGGVVPLISSYLLNVHGVLTAPLFNETHVLRLQPPLTIGREEIDRALAALEAACRELGARNSYALVRHLVAQPGEASPPAQTPEPRPAARPADATPGRFGFLIHYTEEEDIYRSDPSFRQFDEAGLDAWCEWVKQLGPGYARRVPGVTSKTGDVAEGWILSVPMLPDDMRGAGRSAAAGMVRSAVDMGVEGGMSRMGLGAFTSIVTRGGEMATGRGAPITSGNTLTTVAAVQSVEDMARRTGIDLGTARVAVVGASGAIGRLAALMLARRAGRLSLVGNAANPFSPRLLAKVAGDVCESVLGEDGVGAPGSGALAGRLRAAAFRFGLDRGSSGRERGDLFVDAFRSAGERPPLDWTTDLATLADADIVLVATSSDTTLVDPRMLSPGTLVCDVARPPNVAHESAAAQGVLVFDGGLVRPPSTVDLGVFQTLPTDLCWGCLGETILLSLARRGEDFSIGSRLSLEEADLIADLAARHGFAPSAPQWYGRPLEHAEIEGFARRVGDKSRMVRTGRASRVERQKPVLVTE